MKIVNHPTLIGGPNHGAPIATNGGTSHYLSVIYEHASYKGLHKCKDKKCELSGLPEYSAKFVREYKRVSFIKEDKNGKKYISNEFHYEREF